MSKLLPNFASLFFNNFFRFLVHLALKGAHGPRLDHLLVAFALPGVKLRHMAPELLLLFEARSADLTSEPGAESRVGGGFIVLFDLVLRNLVCARAFV